MTNWATTPNRLRKRKAIHVTLSDEARAKLRGLMRKWNWPASAIVEALILGGDAILEREDD